MSIKEVLHTGDLIDADDEIRSPHDFSHDEYPEPDPEQIRASEVLRAIDVWEAAESYAELKKKGAKDADVRRQGGLRGCEAKRKERVSEARRIFLTAHDYPVERPDGSDSELLDRFDAGVVAWAGFREEIKNPATRLMIKEVLEQNIKPLHQ